MTHYICTGGCEGVSGKPGSCQAEDCPHHRRALEPCSCTDGSHGESEADEHTEDAQSK